MQHDDPSVLRIAEEYRHYKMEYEIEPQLICDVLRAIECAGFAVTPTISVIKDLQRAYWEDAGYSGSDSVLLGGTGPV